MVAARTWRAPPASALLGGWGLVAALLVTYIVSTIDRNVISLLVTPIKRELQISDSEMSYLIGGGFAIFYVAAALPLGILADRLHRLRLITVGVILWSLATAACGLAQTYMAFFLARICVGVGEAVLSPCALSLIGDVVPRERLGRAVALFAAGTPVGTGVALIGGGSVIAMAQGGTLSLPFLGELAPWRAIFVLLFAPAILVVLLLALFREPARRSPRNAGQDKAGLREGLRFMRRNPGVFWNMLAFAIVAMVAQGSFPWLPSMFERSYGIAAPDIGFRLGAIASICGIFGLMVGGSIGDYLFRRGRLDAHLWVAMIAGWALAPLMFLTALAPNADIALGSVALMIVVAQIPPGVATAAVQMATPPHLRGLMASINLLMAGLASIAIGPSLIAWLNDYVIGEEGELRYAIAAASLLAPIGALLFQLARRPYRATIQALLAGETGIVEPDCRHSEPR